MIRRATIILSLATIGVGAWLLSRVHSVNNACSSVTSPLTGSGLRIDCQNMVSYYYIGFALTLGGLLVLGLTLFAVRRRREHQARHERAQVARMRLRDRNSMRDAA